MGMTGSCAPAGAPSGVPFGAQLAGNAQGPPTPGSTRVPGVTGAPPSSTASSAIAADTTCDRCIRAHNGSDLASLFGKWPPHRRRDF
jgi:hypothetical protein